MRKVVVLLLLSILLAVIWWLWPSVTFDEDVPASLESRSALSDEGDGITLVRPLVNGVDLGWFALDSGADQIFIDSRHADALGLPTLFKARAGDCRLPVSLRRVKRFQLGRLIMRGPVVAVVDFSRLRPMLDEIDEDLAGIVGYPVFAEAALEIRYGSGDGHDHVALHDPDRYRLPRGEWRRIRVDDGHGLFPARLPGRSEDLFFLDTGKSGNVSFYADYVARQGLLEGRSTTRAGNMTICGETDELEGTLEWFELADLRFERPTVRFKIPGTINESLGGGVAGTIGREFLKEFTVVFDYPHERIAFLRP